MSAIVVGCGPSLRRVQQSRVYFERCYAADFEPRIPLAEKQACWDAWLEHYTFGQPPERRDYARDRLYALESGESVPRLPGLPEAALGPRRVTTTMAVSSPETIPEVEAAQPEGVTEDSAEGVTGDTPEETAEGVTEDTPEETAEDAPPPARLSARERRRRRTPRMPNTVNPRCAIQACRPAWNRCIDTCPPDAVDSCHTACEVELQNCARACY